MNFLACFSLGYGEFTLMEPEKISNGDCLGPRFAFLSFAPKKRFHFSARNCILLIRDYPLYTLKRTPMKKHLRQEPSRAANNPTLFTGKNSFFILCFFILLSAASPGKLYAQASVSNVSFTQFDRYDTDGSLLFENSSLGKVNFSVTPDPSFTYYVNIYAKTKSNTSTWIVQNLPVTPVPVPVPGSCISTEVDFKFLEEIPGTRIESITYAVEVSRLVKATATTTTVRSVNKQAAANLTATPVSYSTIPVGKGRYLNEVSARYSESANLALFSMTAPVAVTNKDKNIPPLDEDTNQCLPGAFARSISWLLGENGYPNVPTPKEIYDTLRKLFASCSTYACAVNKKKDYLKSISGGKGTTDPIWWPSKPGDSIKKYNDKCDVEVSWADNPRGHIITIVGITCGADGCCTIRYRDDDKQGQPGGDTCVKTTVICGDSINTPAGKRKIDAVIVECAPPATTTRPAIALEDNVELLQNVPNPFSNTTQISIRVKQASGLKNAVLIISNMNGTEIRRIPVQLRDGLNQFRYAVPQEIKGVLYYSLEINGRITDSKKMFVTPN